MAQRGDVLPPHPTLPRYYASAAQKRPFLRRIFDDHAAEYDRTESLVSFGTGSKYRREALDRAGLRAGMRVLDVAVGTGLVAREAVSIIGHPRLVLGLDPSAGMIRHAVASLGIPAVMGLAEHLPIEEGRFDFLSMGYALRHLMDLSGTFREFHRVLRPGGRVCVLEVTPPRGALSRQLLKSYMLWVVPCLMRVTSRQTGMRVLWQYYWDTIDACVPPATVLEAMRSAGFEDVRRNVELGIFSEYTARKPSVPAGDRQS